jgi:quercetin dioxygenase-like cupin family protein
MDTTNIDATYNRPEGERKINSPVLLIDLPTYIDQIKNEKAWEESDRNAITVYKSEKLRIVLVAMKKGANMRTEKPENIFTVQVLKGQLNIATNYSATEVTKENIFAIHDNVPYTISAMKKSLFLLTVAD